MTSLSIGRGIKPMRILTAAMLLAVSACVLVSPAPPLEPEKAVEEFMWNYMAAWNRHDSATIGRDFYRLGSSVAEQTRSVESGFVGLRAMGFHHSDVQEIKVCVIRADTALVSMTSWRMTEAGVQLPPKHLAGLYEVKWFADGWRITKLMSRLLAKPFVCPTRS